MEDESGCQGGRGSGSAGHTVRMEQASTGGANDTPSEGAAVFKRPAKRNKNMRARPSAAEDEGPAVAEEEVASSSSVIRVAKVAKTNPLVQGTGSSGGTAGSSMQKAMTHASDVRIAQYDNKATASSEQDVDRTQDAQAQYEAARAMWDDGGDVAADGSKIYRGAKAYKSYTSKPESFDAQVNNGAGPARAPVHYRATSRFDYQPDICKDYKDTGYCGYGDACKFLHDRSDYKTGWQLERQWDEEQKAKAATLAVEAFEASERGTQAPAGGSKDKDDGLPFACLICHVPWHAKSHPVVTKCEHYFCEACALKNAVRTKRCHMCAENTGGIFNKAVAIQEKIDRMVLAQEADVAGAPESEEQILAEYEAAQNQSQKRSYTSGWALV